MTEAASRRALVADLLPILSPEVLCHLPPSLQVRQSPEAVEGWIDARAAESDVYLIRTSADGALIGLLILASDPEARTPPRLHIGYLLGKTAWGQGYASEMIGGLLAACARPVTLMGGVAEDNPASAHVLRKHGFHVQKDLSGDGMEIYAVHLKVPG